MANPPIPTCQTILEIALRKSGVVGIDEKIETPVLNDAWADANDLLALWQRKRWLIYHLKNYEFVSTGAESYNVGAGQNFPINPRPDRLESAFLRQLANGTGQSIDWALSVIPSMEDYNRIILKSLGTFSTSIFYDPAWPVGILKPWPVPQAAIYSIHVCFKETLQTFPNLQDPMNLPPEYGPALKFNLARVLRASYQMPADPEINSIARASLNAIRLANSAVSTLQMPTALRRGGNGPAYNYKSDQP